jgi:hypothetical protein
MFLIGVIYFFSRKIAIKRMIIEKVFDKSVDSYLDDESGIHVN